MGNNPREVATRPDSRRSKGIDDLAADGGCQFANGLRTGLLDVVVVLEGVEGVGGEVGEGLG